jgi:hypothetical protein
MSNHTFQLNFLIIEMVKIMEILYLTKLETLV